MGNDDYLSIYAMSIVAVAIAETLGPMVGGAFVQGFQGAVVKRPDGTLDEQLKYQYAFLTYGIITVVCAAAATFFAHRVMKTKKMMRERDNDGSELVQRL
jgi:MFS family permease